MKAAPRGHLPSRTVPLIMPAESTQACNSVRRDATSTRVSPAAALIRTQPTPSGSGGSLPSGNRADTYAAVRVGRPRYVPAMVTYMLSEGATGWSALRRRRQKPRYCPETASRCEAAAVMRENGDPVAGRWSAVLDAAVPPTPFHTEAKPWRSRQGGGWWSDVFDAEEPADALGSRPNEARNVVAPSCGTPGGGIGPGHEAMAESVAKSTEKKQCFSARQGATPNQS